MKAGDYVQLRRRFPPFLRKGTRGRVMAVNEGEVYVRIHPNMSTWSIPRDLLTVIDRDETGGIVWQSTQS